jgi:hypothetical protein
MIGTIRKHSSWLWWIVASLTIISFILWNTSPQTRNGGGKNGGLGTIYGKPVTAEAFNAAQREFYIYYWLHYGSFPDHGQNVSRAEIERETYVRLLMTEKARSMGIHVGEDAQVAGANDVLREIGRNHEPVPLSDFVERVLAPESLTAADFQRFIVGDLAIQQMVQVLGLPGELVTPQEASQLYDREHQEVSAQAVFFSASNYMAKAEVSPAEVGQFYTNYLTHYQLPNRVQVNYIAYPLSNYEAVAVQKLGRTNLDARVDSIFAQRGLDAIPGAKTPAEAKDKIREALMQQATLNEAGEQARQFLTTLFAMDPVNPDNFVTLAKKQGLAVRTTAPFSEEDGPEEFPASTELVKTAFSLSSDSPFSPKPVAGSDAVYIFGLANQLPSSVPPLNEIRDQVARDCKLHAAAVMARAAGTNFYVTAITQMATGKTFAHAAIGAGRAPEALEPFSLMTRELPGLQDPADLDQIKRAAFSTAPGHVSPFVATAEGGFVMFVQSMLPVDQAAKNAAMPQYLAEVRRNRENEAFNLWLQTEANRELKNTPVYQELAAGKGSPSGQ